MMLTSSACLGLLLRDLQVPGDAWCTWSYTWIKVPPAASPANTSDLLLCFCSRSPSIDNFVNSQIVQFWHAVQMVHGQNWVSEFMASAFATADRTATNSAASCDLLCQLTTTRNRCFPDILWHRGTKSGQSCVYFMWCNCSPHPLFTTASSQLPGVNNPLAFTHIFALFCPNISRLFSTSPWSDAGPLRPPPGACWRGRQALEHTDVSGL